MLEKGDQIIEGNYAFIVDKITNRYIYLQVFYDREKKGEYKNEGYYLQEDRKKWL